MHNKSGGMVILGSITRALLLLGQGHVVCSASGVTCLPDPPEIGSLGAGQDDRTKDRACTIISCLGG
jgi:hypothetical protein